jgi:hypothetical protein
MAEIPVSLRALLSNLIDYAGLYPPAALPLAEAVEKYREHLVSPESWMLNRMVLPSTALLDANWRITLLTDAEPGRLPPQVESLETKRAQKFSLPTYCEVPIELVPPGAFAKIRTGGLTPEAIPSAGHIADFLTQAAVRRIPFKATAGLHHPIRSRRTHMHGFVNVFAAAAFAWHGVPRDVILGVLNERDPHAFAFGERELTWRGHTLSDTQIKAARRDFAHSFGSCSFEEPIADLRKLGWLGWLA